MYILITYRPVARRYKISDKLCHKLALAARAIKLYEYYPNNKDRDGIRDVVHEICLRYDELDDLLNDLKDISEKTGVSKKVVLELIHIVKCIDTYWETLRKEPNNEDNTNNR